MLAQLFIATGFAIALVVAVTGRLSPKWRNQPRNAYYSTATVMALLAALVASAGGLFAADLNSFAWGAVAVAGWLTLEALFEAWKSTRTADRFFAAPAEPEAVEALAEPEAASEAPAAPLAPRRNPTPRGPQQRRRR